MFGGDTNVNGIMHQKFSRSKDSQDAVALTVSGGATPNDLSDEIVVVGAAEMFLYANNGDSTDLDVELYVTYKEGEDYTTTPYASMNLGADENDGIPISVGMYGVKVKVVNGDAGNATVVSAGIRATWR